MDFDLRIKALAQLAKSETESARSALRDELKEVAATLATETDHDLLEQGLAVLEVIGDRFSSEATTTLLGFVGDVEQRRITYAFQASAYASEIAKYQNARTLIVRAIEVLLRMRYLETTLILRALMKLTHHPAREVSGKAISGLKDMARYDLRVFYGDEVQMGIGARPQLAIVQELERLPSKELKDYLFAILALAEGLLSPTIEGTSWTYNTVTLSRGATPALPTVSQVRARTVTLLKRIYRLAETIGERLRVLSVLNDATRPSHAGSTDEGAGNMLAQNAVEVLQFYADLVKSEALQIVQKIEANSYWIFFHSNKPEVQAAADTVRRALAENDEYHIYRVLIGFEGVFGDWAQLRDSQTYLEDKDRFREEKAAEFAESINSQNYAEWRARILDYAKTESNYLATFPIFFKILEAFAVAQPALAQRFIREDVREIAAFLIPILRGLWVGQQKEVRRLLEEWIKEGQYLGQIAGLFLDNPALDRQLVVGALKRAIELDDQAAVRTVLSVAVSNYSPDKPFLLKELFFPSLEFLTDRSNPEWIFDFWFRRQARSVVGDLDEAGFKLLLNNLALIDKIDYHAEEILYLIAGKAPGLVLDFLCNRLTWEARNRETRPDFEAIPFAWHKLNEPLSKRPKDAVQAVRGQYDGDFGMFAFRGARLLKNIFPEFPLEFRDELLALIREGGERNLDVVLAVLRNYEGQPFIHDVCKAVIKAVPIDSEYRTEVAIALESTGVVAGEYGLAEAYERKIKEIKDWLTDPDEKVQEFARWYSSNLEQRIVGERKRVDEEIALRKHRYGE